MTNATLRGKPRRGSFLRIVGIVAWAASCVPARGADVTVTWDASATPESLADGALTFTYEGGAVKKITATPVDSGSIAISGDSLSFAEEARIDFMAPGKFVFETGAAFPGALVCDALNAQNFTWYLERPLWANEQVKIPQLEGRRLEDYRVVSSYFNLIGYDKNVYQNAGEGRAYHQVCSNFEGRVYLDMQLQTTSASEKWLECVKVRLVQDQGAVTVQALWARYVERSLCEPGFDFENPGDVTLGSNAVPDGKSSGGYTIDNLTFECLRSPEETQVVFTRPVTLDGRLTLTNRVSLLADNRDGAFDSGLSLTNDLHLFSGKLMFLNQSKVTLSGKVAGVKGGIAVNACAREVTDASQLVRTYADATTGVNEITDTTWHVLLRNTQLACVTNITCLLAGSSIGTPLKATTCFFTNNGTTASAQMQCWNSNAAEGKAPGTVKCVVADLRQQDGNVEISTSKAYFIHQAAAVGYEFPGEGSTGYIPQYHMTNIAVYLSRDLPYGTSLKLAGENACDGGSVTVGACGDSFSYAVDAAHVNPFPLNGFFDLYGRSNLKFTHGQTISQSGTSPSSTVTIHTNATLAYDSSFISGMLGPKIVLDGGAITMVNVVNYANALELNGGRFTAGNGGIIFVGYGGLEEAVWRVRGGTASVCEVPEIRSGAQATLGTWVLDVDDVTGDAAADLTISAPITRHDKFSYPRLVKRGAGTVKALKPITAMMTLFSLEGGWLEVGSEDVFTAANNLTLSGGGIAVGAGLAVELGTVEVTADSALTVASGATLALASAEELNWTGRLDISAESRAVRFGTSKSALTSAQKRKLYLNGDRAKLDEHGYVVSARGFWLIFR